MATMEERRKQNAKALFGSEDKRKKSASDFQKKLKEVGVKKRAAKAAKDKKRIESQKAINKKLTNVKKEGAAKRKDAREQRRIRVKNDINKARGKTTTPKRPSSPLIMTPRTRKAPPATDKGGRSAVPGTMRGKQVNTKMGPNMSKVTKVTAADRKKQKGGADNRSTMQKLFGASEEKRKMGRDMQRKAQASMGFNKGGSLKTPTNPGLKKLPTEVRNKMGFMNKGGKVKKMKHGGKCKIDGIAIRGRTRARTK